jgi:ABC-type polysaccharide/polyol phosphate export permease
MNARQDNVATVATRDAAGLESEVIRRIVPTKRRLRLADVPGYAQVISVVAGRDFKIKYKQSLLGPLWLIFQPFALFAGFLIAFRTRSGIGAGVPYIVFALSGLMVWSFFQAAMPIGVSSLITNFQLVRFTPCPRLAFPVAGIIASLPSLIVPVAGAVVAAAVAGDLSPRVLLLPVGLAWLFFLTAGIVALGSALAVRFRDIISVLPFVLSLGLFLAPVAYPLSGLSPTVRFLVELNPLTGLLEACRWMLLAPYHPSLRAVGLSLVITAGLIGVGWRVFGRLETTMADEI